MKKITAFKFPERRHFGFYDVLSLPLLFAIRQPLHVIKSKMAAGGKFQNHKLFHILLLLNVICLLTCKIWKLGIISKNPTSTCHKNGGSV